MKSVTSFQVWKPNRGKLTTSDAGRILYLWLSALSFSHLSHKEILTVVPCVCKSWSKVVLGPYCWQEIDIYDWSLRFRRRSCSVDIFGESCWHYDLSLGLDRMLQMLVTRSCGSFEKLCIHGLPSDLSFALIANHSGSLQTLRLTRGGMSNSIVEQVADRLSKLTFLDLTYCTDIGAKALEAFGKHCKSLSTLKRWIDPEELEGICQDNEAHAIAMTMPQLKQLEICFMLLTTGGVLEILSHCRELQFLDISGCSGVRLDGDFMKKNHANVYVLGPATDRHWLDALDDCSSISDRYDFSDYDVCDYDGVCGGYDSDIPYTAF